MYVRRCVSHLVSFRTLRANVFAYASIYLSHIYFTKSSDRIHFTPSPYVRGHYIMLHIFNQMAQWHWIEYAHMCSTRINGVTKKKKIKWCEIAFVSPNSEYSMKRWQCLAIELTSDVHPIMKWYLLKMYVLCTCGCVDVCVWVDAINLSASFLDGCSFYLDVHKYFVLFSSLFLSLSHENFYSFNNVERQQHQ